MTIKVRSQIIHLTNYAPVAQVVRAAVLYTDGRGFKSFLAYHLLKTRRILNAKNDI